LGEDVFSGFRSNTAAMDAMVGYWNMAIIEMLIRELFAEDQSLLESG
jgi:hypothetical protein